MSETIHWHKPGATRWAACGRKGTTTTRKTSVTCRLCQKAKGFDTVIGLERILEITNHVNEGERGSVTKRELFEAVRYWSCYASDLAAMAAQIGSTVKVTPALSTLRFFKGSFPAGRGWRICMDHELVEKGFSAYIDDKWYPVGSELIGKKVEDVQYLIRRKVRLIA